MVTSKGGARGRGRAAGGNGSEKTQQIAAFVQEPLAHLTTSQGLAVVDNHNSLKAGVRGPTLAEDFFLREKLGHFARERTAERVVNARGCGAHGVFKLYKPLSEYTTAQFLNDTEAVTPVFVRFSNLAGERGSADTVRDVRGFAVKFYTGEGNYDLVGSNVPVFYLQDAIKFPDLIHAMKPEPHHGMPQASTAHDTFWDFASLMPETSHMLMWAMSDRTLPRSYRMMEGHGVHTFRMINGRGESHFVKFHWKPRQGVHTLLREEAQELAGRSPDFLRRDLWDAIAAEQFPEWELGLQLITPSQAATLGIDLLDPTKLVPQELVPVTPVGRLTLNRNPEDFFAETEQVAFNPGHLVPGIDFSADPVLQGRLFSYSDAQASRLQGPNFDQLPINRSLCPVHNFQRGGAHRMAVARGPVSYEPHSIESTGGVFRVDGAAAGFQSQADAVENTKTRARDASFDDHFSQARLFYNSIGAVERDHLAEAFAHELVQVRSVVVRQRMLNNLAHVDERLARKIAQTIGADAPSAKAAEGEAGFRSFAVDPDGLTEAPSLSMASSQVDGKRHLPGRKVGILVADGVDVVALRPLQHALTAAGLVCVLVAPRMGGVQSAGGRRVAVDGGLAWLASVDFDAVVVAGGPECVHALAHHEAVRMFLRQAWRHGKPIVAMGEAFAMLPTVIQTVEETAPTLKVATKAPVNPTTASMAGVAHFTGAMDLVDLEIQTVMDTLAAHRYAERLGPV